MLADRIAILNDGRLVCCGTSLYLKRQYGYGYRLVISKAPEECDSEAISHAVQRHMFGAICEINSATELVFRVAKVRQVRVIHSPHIILPSCRTCRKIAPGSPVCLTT